MKMIIDGRLSHSYMFMTVSGEDEIPRDWIADPSKGDQTPRKKVFNYPCPDFKTVWLTPHEVSQGFLNRTMALREDFSNRGEI